MSIILVHMSVVKKRERRIGRMGNILSSTQAKLRQAFGGAATKPEKGKAIVTQSYESGQKTSFNRQSNLQGRGQAGVAGFYKMVGPGDQSEYLIKVDDAATCFFEGGARFAESVIPGSLKKCVNFASAGSARIDNEDEEVAVSIQPRLAKAKPWDIVMTGEKRNPKRPVSFEATHAGKILDSIDSMTDQAKDELAMAICVSAMVGDESLHVGQFMVETDEKTGAITHVIRIDFGARERFAIKRNEDNDLKHATSNAYKRSGQMGKDYVSYLLAHPEIKIKVMRFWNMQSVNVDALKEKYKEQMSKQFDNLPEKQRASVLIDVASVVNRGAKNPVKCENIDEFTNVMWPVVSRRVESLKNQAKDSVLFDMMAILNELRRQADTNPNMKDEILGLAVMNEADDMLEKYHIIKNDLGKLGPPELAIKLLVHLQAKFQCCLYDHPDQKNNIEPVIAQLKDLKAKYQVLNELKKYKKHLNQAVLDKNKKSTVSQVIKKIEADLAKSADMRADLNHMVDENFKADISKQRHWGVSGKSTGEILVARVNRLLVAYVPPHPNPQPGQISAPALPPRASVRTMR